ncbi:hypothetical protein OEA41_007448 [Lepraria neglecta]|uniref:Uncharacterized protein n=1 Tax=Lepraria neglecta TaxID=209136 RepID=A0AAE0DMY5_9LECA|nr:hypothetical protein OEA41_007448 [Lepraria neglecta]
MNETLAKLHQKHRSFVRISYNEVSINHPDALQILTSSLRKGDFYKLFAIPSSNYQNAMSVPDVKRTIALRSNVAPGYTLTSVIKSESFIDKTIELMESRLDEFSKVGEPFQLGHRFGFLDQGKHVGDSIKNTFGLALYLTTMAYIQWLHAILLGNPILRWLDFQPNEHSFNKCVKNIAARKENPEARVDMMEHWMTQHVKYPERMSEKDNFCAAIGNLGAGGDTLGSVQQAVFYYLLKEDPKHLQRLQKEIKLASADGLLSPVVSYVEAQKLSFLQAVADSRHPIQCTLLIDHRSKKAFVSTSLDMITKRFCPFHF